MTYDFELYWNDLKLFAHLLTDTREWRAIVRADLLFFGEIMNDLATRQV